MERERERKRDTCVYIYIYIYIQGSMAGMENDKDDTFTTPA